jgi:anti-sigma B factor antagonist
MADATKADKPATSMDVKEDLVIVQVLVPDLDENHTRQLHSDLTTAALASPSLPFVLDMTKVKFLPSLTLGAMVRLATEFRARKQRLLLAALQPTIRQVITITRLDRVFEIIDTVDNAVKVLRG